MNVNDIDLAADLKDLPWAEQMRRVQRAKAQRWDAVQDLERTGEARGRLLASEQRDFDKHKAELDALQAILDERQIDFAGVLEGSQGSESILPRRGVHRDEPEYRDGVPLTEGQSFAGFVRAKGLDRHDGEEPLSLRKIIRGQVLGNWEGADNERRAMSGLSQAAGGWMIPQSLSAQIVDLARNQARVLQAGARIVPMGSRKVVVPKWAADPTPSWRVEEGAVLESTAMLSGVELNAKSLASITRASLEWLEDVEGGEEALLNAFAAQFALSLDAAALYGAGGDEPEGVKTNADVTKTPVAADGAVPTWAALTDSVGRLRDVNEEPTAQVMADRTRRELETQRENGSTGPYLAPPPYLDGVRRLATQQVKTDLDQGTSVGVASDLFTADWGQLFVGIRTDLQIKVLDQLFLETGQVGFFGWFRGDVAVARAEAFDVVTGLLGA
jgi:HK97 family phage major capsid protein